MDHRRLVLQVSSSVLVALLLVACGASSVSVAPTATPLIPSEPSATRQPPAPTQTAVPPTSTPIPTAVPSATPTQMAVPPTLAPTATTMPMPTATSTPEPTDTPIPQPPPHCRSSIEEPTEIIHAVHMGGNWGTNWEETNTLPNEYFEYLQELNVNWVGISVALHYEDSMDSTVERKYSGVVVPTFTDEFLKQMIRAYHQHGFCVYLTLAFEPFEAEEAARPAYRWFLGEPETHWEDPSILPEFWPWAIDHPDHQRFVAEFWESYTEQAVHFGQLAGEEGVALYSLGTETDGLFRTRPSDLWPNDFGEELNSMVAAVREVYSGLLTYDMHYSALTDADIFGPGSDHLWEDLGLDVIGLSTYFPLAECPPVIAFPVETLERRWEQVFQDYLIPLQAENPDRPILFTEYGYMDSVESPVEPSAGEEDARAFADRDGNGLDDGEEMQANIHQALFNVMGRHPGVVNGVFLWDMWMADNDRWANEISIMRGFSVRGKLAEDVVRYNYGAAPRSTAPTPLPPSSDVVTQLQGETCVIYDDGFALDYWIGWTWDGDVDTNSSEVVHTGEQAIEITLQPEGGLALILHQLDISPYTWLIFQVNGGETADQRVGVSVSLRDVWATPPLDVLNYIEGGQLEPGQWHQVLVPLSVLSPDGGEIDQINFVDMSGGGASTFYLDEIRFVAAGP